MKPVALVFDLDDTLYPEREFVLGGMTAAGRWLQRERGIRGFAAVARSLFRDGVRGTIFDETLRRLCLDDASVLVPQLVAVYRAHRPKLTMHPDARWAIGRFRRRFKLGLITDGYARTQRNKVASLGLEADFDALVFTDDLGREHWKPSPRPFRQMMHALGCAGPDCIYVGDNPAKDFLAPNRLGWLTVQIIRPDGEYHGASTDALPQGHRPRHVIRSLRELAWVLPSFGKSDQPARKAGARLSRQTRPALK
jgi:putative hydrolase of the HAD superfamily